MNRADEFHIWLARAVADGASDLHLIDGYPPALRLHGELVELSEPPLADGESHALLAPFCPPEITTRLHEQKNADLSLAVDLDGRNARFRTNLFHAGEHRRIPHVLLRRLAADLPAHSSCRTDSSKLSSPSSRAVSTRSRSPPRFAPASWRASTTTWVRQRRKQARPEISP